MEKTTPQKKRRLGPLKIHTGNKRRRKTIGIDDSTEGNNPQKEDKLRPDDSLKRRFRGGKLGGGTKGTQCRWGSEKVCKRILLGLGTSS